MAQNNANGSNRAKFLRKAKRKASQATRLLKQRSVDLFNSQTLLIAVLAQHGGEVTITQGTVQQAIEGFVKQQLSVATIKSKTEGEVIVRLVTQEQAAELVAEHTPTPVDPVVEAAVEGFDANGDYQFNQAQQSDALLSEEGTPYETIQQIGKDEEENV